MIAKAKLITALEKSEVKIMAKACSANFLAKYHYATIYDKKHGKKYVRMSIDYHKALITLHASRDIPSRDTITDLNIIELHRK
jgi:hypothetical protein